MISTRLGGIVSAIAPDVASSAIIDVRFWPRRSMSGNSTGATAAMSAIFEPEIPDTRYIAPTSTMLKPAAQMSDQARERGDEPLRDARRLHQQPRKMNSGTASSTRFETPSCMRCTTMSGRDVRDDQDVADRSQPERERDRHADRDARAGQHDEEQHEVHVAQPGERAALEPHQRADHDRREHDARDDLRDPAPSSAAAPARGSATGR